MTTWTGPSPMQLPPKWGPLTEGRAPVTPESRRLGPFGASSDAPCIPLEPTRALGIGSDNAGAIFRQFPTPQCVVPASLPLFSLFSLSSYPLSSPIAATILMDLECWCSRLRSAVRKKCGCIWWCGRVTHLLCCDAVMLWWKKNGVPMPWVGRIGLASRCGGGGRPDPFGVPHSSVLQPARRKVQVVAPGRRVELSDYEEQPL